MTMLALSVLLACHEQTAPDPDQTDPGPCSPDAFEPTCAGPYDVMACVPASDGSADASAVVEQSCHEQCRARGEDTIGCGFHPISLTEQCWCGSGIQTEAGAPCRTDPIRNECRPDQACVGDGEIGACWDLCEAGGDCPW